jgi:hypothetical protein
MILVAVLVINYTMIGFGINVPRVHAEDSEDIIKSISRNLSLVQNVD